MDDLPVDVEEQMDEVLPLKYSITSYGVDYVIDGLVKRISEGSIFIPPFQRSFVWNIKQASRFIESLLLGLPVPGIFMSKEEKTQKLLVIDGQQRLKSLQYFYEDRFPSTSKGFSLTGIQEEFLGMTYKTLPEEIRRKLDDSILHATIVKQDEPNDDSSIYHIFERLNTGSSILFPQEIRACIYHGQFNDLLKELNNNQDWKILFGSNNSRMRDEEMILRFFALYINGGRYKKPIKGFLNSFMHGNQSFQLKNKDELSNLFYKTIKTIHENLGEKVFRPKNTFKAALFDSIMVGVASRLESGLILNKQSFSDAYAKLISNVDFIESTDTHTSDLEKVSQRIKLAKSAFADIK